ncbi:MAG: serine/threonine protein kinase [Oscillatoriaceae cyanobacterium Prado104]|jgi:WD40 repeat protein|nr:serine/threonine protein kinase [Oscillatoriaceae cyanobacterium Prado104]
MSYCLNPHCQKPQNPDSTIFCLACGSKLLLKNRYRPIQLIGAGTFGRTFLAVDEDRLQTRCAIKQFLPQVTGIAELKKATALFKQEAQRLCDLGQHPQIPTLLASFEQDKHLYLVEELIEGNNLLQELQQHGSFSEEQIWELLVNLLPVLQFVHEQQVIHRDVKPENILRRTSPNVAGTGAGPLHQRGVNVYQSSGDLPGRSLPTGAGTGTGPLHQKKTKIAGSASLQKRERGGQFVLVDFGVAKQINGFFEQKTGTITGTAGYAPIEQIRGGKAYPASDLYSLGVTCIHLLTGAELSDLFDPIEGEWMWISHLSKKGIAVSQTLELILNNLLKDSVKERFQSAAIVLQQLVEFGQYPRSQISYHSLPNTATNNSHSNQASAIEFPQTNNISPANVPNLSFQKWQLARVLQCHATVNGVAISPQGNILVTASNDKTIKLWHLQTGELIHTYFGHSAPVNAVAISPDGRMLVSGSLDRKIIEWKLDKREMIREFYSDFGSPYSHRYGSVHSVAFSCDGGAIASASGDKTIKIWNQRNGQLVQKLAGHSGKVLSVSFRPQSTIFASGSADRTIKIWRIGIQDCIRTLSGHSDSVCSVEFSQDGKTIVSGSADSTVKLWNAETGEVIHTFIGHSEAVISVAISFDRATIASGSRDGTVKLWHIQTGELLCSLAGCNPVAFSPDSQTLATGRDGGEICIWQVSV